MHFNLGFEGGGILKNICGNIVLSNICGRERGWGGGGLYPPTKNLKIKREKSGGNGKIGEIGQNIYYIILSKK